MHVDVPFTRCSYCPATSFLQRQRRYFMNAQTLFSVNGTNRVSAEFTTLTAAATRCLCLKCIFSLDWSICQMPVSSHQPQMLRSFFTIRVRIPQSSRSKLFHTKLRYSRASRREFLRRKSRHRFEFALIVIRL